MQTLRSLIARISWRRALPITAVCLLLIAPSLTLAFQLMSQGRAQGIVDCPTATAQPTPSATTTGTTPSPTMSASPGATVTTTMSPLGTYGTPTATPTVTGTQTATPTMTATPAPLCT